jgi:predicted ATP-grasp superfamily ATP-dependent carboligase
LHVLLYEHAVSGGFVNEKIPSNLLNEGYAMLRCLASDFKAAGHSTTVLMDSRLTSFTHAFRSEKIIKIYSTKQLLDTLSKNRSNHNACYIIAPETNDSLYNLVDVIEHTDAISLNCSSQAIKQASDKSILPSKSTKLGLKIPKTRVFQKYESMAKIKRICKELQFPLIIKAATNTSCSLLSFVENENEVIPAVKKIKNCGSNNFIIIQEFEKGLPVSVSLICTSREIIPLSLNLQDIFLAPPNLTSSYNGGVVPFEHNQQSKVFDAAKRIASSFDGFRGYVGVDLVLSENEISVIETNPRLSTSYVGLRNVLKANIAQLIVDAVTSGKISSDFKFEGYSFFSRITLPKPLNSAYFRIRPSKEVYVPPSLAKGKLDQVFVVVYSNKRDEASTRLCKIRKRLQNTS